MFIAVLTAASPSATAVPDDAVTPGPLGFTVIAIISLAAILLILDMVRRIRRVNTRQRVRDEIAAELASTPDVDEPPAPRG